MKALVVGAGAVGQVFGYHLAQGGADVTFLVKPKYVEECRRGFTLYRLPKTTKLEFKAEVVSEPVAADQIYLTVSSTAFRAGTWFAELARATGDATIVVLQPGMNDHAFAAQHAAEARLVDGTINFLSYHAPLPGETRFAEPGMAYWFFPGKGPFSSSSAGERADAVVAALRAGKLPAKRVADVGKQTAFPAAILSTFVAALEAGDWSFRGMNKALAGRAGREAMRVAAHERGVSAPFGPRLASRALGPLSWIARRVAPVDLETYMRVHFTKVGDQMHEGIANYVERGRAASLDVGALEQLTKLLRA